MKITVYTKPTGIESAVSCAPFEREGIDYFHKRKPMSVRNSPVYPIGFMQENIGDDSIPFERLGLYCSIFGCVAGFGAAAWILYSMVSDCVR